MLNHDLIAKDRPRPVLGPDASARPWEHTVDAIRRLQKFTHHRPSGRPSHTTPLLAVWVMDGMTFTTGADEQKAKNLGRNPQCIWPAGTSTLTLAMTTSSRSTASLVSDRNDWGPSRRHSKQAYGWHLTREANLPGTGCRTRSALARSTRTSSDRASSSPSATGSPSPRRATTSTESGDAASACLFTGRDQHGMRPAVARGVAGPG